MDTGSQIEKFVPDWVVRLASEDPGLPGTAERFPAAVLIADVSGFTAFGERLARRGPEGAEKLWRVINAFFGATVDLIQAHGGDVLRFAGDAPLVMWRATPETLTEVVRRAAACGLELQETLGRYDTGENATLSFKIGLGCGEVVAIRLGGVAGHWEPLVGGEAFSDMARATDEALDGDVVVSDHAWSLIKGDARGRRTRKGNWRLQTVRTTVEPVRTEIPVLDEAARRSIRGLVQRGVIDLLDAGHGEWLGELRTVTSVFVRIDGIDYDSPDAPERLDAVLRSLQAAVYRTEGVVNQFLVDDNGTVLLAAWGLPSCTHEDDPARAVRASLDISRALDSLGLRGSVGISTGRVFCGVKGNARRSEYGLLGASVNLAARLMQRADGLVLCEEDTVAGVRGKIEFDTLPAVQVKGRERELALFRPRPGRTDAVRASGAMVGRTRELAALTESLDALEAGRGSATLVTGEAGIGKSRLLDALFGEARARGLCPLAGSADAIEHRTAYHAFRQVFSSLLGLDESLGGDARRKKAMAWFEDRPSLRQIAPIFNPVLRLDLPENDITAAMEGEGRAETARAAFIEALSAVSPLLVVLDDLQWMDSASWELARIAIRDLPGAMFVFATRPPDAGSTLEHEELLRLSSLARVDLAPLDHIDVVDLVCNRLGVTELPEQVSRLVQERAEGHPFYSEELAFALRDAGLISIEGDRCAISPEAGDLSGVELPSTLDGVIASRLDRLTPTQQLCLKTASVIGRSFLYRMLRDIYPIAEERGTLSPELEAIRRLNLTEIDAPEPDLAYLFKHVVTQQVAYGQLLFQQRRELHQAAAKWYEAGNGGDVASLYPLLAHHWQRAEVRDKAIDALEAAGEQALHAFANREAIAFITAARDLDVESDRPATAERRARWERALGKAYVFLGRYAEGREHHQRAAKLLGQPLPRTMPGLSWAFSVESLRQVVRRYRGAPAGRIERPGERIAAANAYYDLGIIGYYTSDMLLLLYSTLKALNLAEDAGPSPDLAQLKSAVGIAMSAVPLRRGAESYTTEAIEMAERFDDVLAIARTHQYRGAYLVGMGEWEAVVPHIEKAVAGYTRLGNGRGKEEALNCQILTTAALGRYAEAEDQCRVQLASARWREDGQVEFWARVHQAELSWLQGRIEEALAQVEAIEGAKLTDALVGRRLQGLRVHLLLERGDVDAAHAAARSLIPPKRASSMLEVLAYTCLPALQLARWESEGPGNGVRRAARTACGALTTFAGIYTLALPLALYFEGRLQRLSGDTPRARDAWTRSLEAAERMKVPRERILAHEALASITSGLEHASHLASIEEIREALRTGFAAPLFKAIRSRPSDQPGPETERRSGHDAGGR